MYGFTIEMLATDAEEHFCKCEYLKNYIESDGDESIWWRNKCMQWHGKHKLHVLYVRRMGEDRST